MTAEQKKRLLKAKVAVALQSELGRTPKKEEIEEVTLLARVLYKAILGLHYKRKEKNKSGQLAIMREDLTSSRRETGGRSQVEDQEAPQPGTSAAPESRAGAEGLPIKDYDSLQIRQITRRLSGLSIEELERLREYEAKNQNREPLLARFEERIRIIRHGGTAGDAKGNPGK